ncbi:lipoprotein-releasing ABC transporter permease subunit [Colwellia sp. 1_MG-2023]|uniref:lipoprotein-releasing ABC transporter permease subunit n=1 Tax=Colwellia sp. 1_MG-2023 TaxID=3062649 RepID=UPI0026E3A4E3|nr:lipoprotein-releasing ABC transporter permease subunit [Colwellia sp. 1_MG-2023]MDO6447059.1 lipoprotein-releasing ABC transporter permease subunit [Colwellia sp. 1_MG-2023]
MFHPVSFFIGLRYSRSRNPSGFVSFITFFSIIGILLGVAALITVVSVMNGFEGELKKRILGIVPHVIVSDKQDNQPIKQWQTVKQQLSILPHVERVTPIIENEALVLSNSTLQGVKVQGVFPKQENQNLVSQSMITGDFLSLEKSPYSVVIGQALARKLGVVFGDKIRVVLPNKTTFTPMGRIPVQRTFTVVGLFNIGSQVDDSVVYVHGRDLAKLLRKKADEISQLRLYLDDAFRAKQVVNNIPPSLSQFNFTIWNESQGVLFSAVKMEKNMMWLMLSLIIAVAAFNIVSALVMVVIDKQGEIAILQTFGMNRAGIVKIFISQGVINGVWGVALGTIAGVFITLNLNTLLSFLDMNVLGAGYTSQALPVDLQVNHVIIIACSALLMSFLATLYPAFRASNTQPAEVLRNE